MNLQSKCPWCSKKNTGVSDPSGVEIPGPGDITICFTCGGWSFFEPDMSLRRPTDEEWMEISQLDTVQQLSKQWLETFGRKQ